MGIQDLIFRVFVSSTFSDLIAERNALQEHVFPRLSKFCQKHGARFQAIDLRWGISNEAALDQSTMRICRAEIARCQAVTPRPNFVVLLGDRHGWRPLPDEIPAAEFEALLSHLPAELAKRWYKLDENAVCPLPDDTGLDKGQYVLQPRTGELEDYDRWFDEVEGPLGDAFRRAARALGLPEAARRKYEASAMAQEIHDGAFEAVDPQEHVLAFIREICTEDGRPLRETLPPDAVLKDFLDLKKGKHELDGESQDQLDALTQRLQENLGKERIKTYTARWIGNGASTEHLQQLCDDAYEALEQLILTQIEQHRTMPPLEEERLRHQKFAQRRTRDFTGQAEPLAEIGRYLSPTPNPTAPLVVHGESGSGKSALLAKAVLEMQESEDAASPSTLDPPPSLLYRFIGATANSTDPRSLLEGLCRELGEHYGADNTDLPLDLNKLTVIFRERLALATAEHPLSLFLDALDQLQVADRPELLWLPDRLPAHVRLVVSAIPGPILDSLRSRWPSARLLELGPMNPDDATELLQKWLQRAKRRLSTEVQRQALRAGFTLCGLPLYLRLAFEEAQRWRSYDQPQPPSPDVDGLIERLFQQLSDQLYHEPLLVERAISYLRCSRYGLTEDEILDLLANDPEYWERFLASAHHALPMKDGKPIQQLPIVIWSRLYHDLEPYLSWRSADDTALMVFFHTRFNEVADHQFLSTDTIRLARHNSMAVYFHAQDYFLESVEEQRARTKRLPPRSRSANVRKVVELPWQRLEVAKLSGEWDALGKLLTDLLFVEAKTAAGMAFDLVRDHKVAERLIPSGRLGMDQETRLKEWRDFVSISVHRLANGEEPFLQMAANYARGSVVSESAELAAQLEAKLWLKHLNRPNRVSHPTCVMVLTAHDQWVEAVAVTSDGRLAVSGGSDGRIRVWDLESGNCQLTLEGHSERVRALAITPDDRLLVTASNDATLRIWDLKTGICLHRLVGHVDCIGAVAVSPNGELIVSGSGESLKSAELWLWNLRTGERTGELVGHESGVWAVAISPNSVHVLSAAADGTLRMWDITSGKTLWVQRGLAVCSIAIAPNGEYAYSA